MAKKIQKKQLGGNIVDSQGEPKKTTPSTFKPEEGQAKTTADTFYTVSSSPFTPKDIKAQGYKMVAPNIYSNPNYDPKVVGGQPQYVTYKTISKGHQDYPEGGYGFAMAEDPFAAKKTTTPVTTTSIVNPTVNTTPQNVQLTQSQPEQKRVWRSSYNGPQGQINVYTMPDGSIQHIGPNNQPITPIGKKDGGGISAVLKTKPKKYAVGGWVDPNGQPINEGDINFNNMSDAERTAAGYKRTTQQPSTTTQQQSGGGGLASYLNQGLYTKAGNNGADLTDQQKQANTQKGIAAAGIGIGGATNASQTINNPNASFAQKSNSLDTTTEGVAGAINPIVGAGVKAGHGIGAQFRTNAEATDSQGNLINKGKAERMAMLGSLFDPAKAFATRASYKGGFTDLTGEGYAKALEADKKKQMGIDPTKQAVANQYNASYTGMAEGGITGLAKAIKDKNKNIYITSYASGGKVKGGDIEGKGGPKSDSIKAKVVEGSFVVPSENLGLAKILREQYLNKNPNAKATLNQKGGETVKLSNGEHLFTPQETLELYKNGVNPHALAPNADASTQATGTGQESGTGLWHLLNGGKVQMNKKAFIDEHKELVDILKSGSKAEQIKEANEQKEEMSHYMAKGGLTPGKAHQMLIDNSAQGHPLTPKQKRYFGYIYGKSKQGKAEGGYVAGQEYDLSPKEVYKLKKLGYEIKHL